MIQKTNIVGEKDIADILVMRTGMDHALILTLLHYYQRTILHSVLNGKIVDIEGLFTIYKRNNNVEIELSEQAKRYIKKK